MKNKLLVPDIGDFEKVEIIEILVKTGDNIKKNDSVVTLESDKSSVEVPSIYEGIVESVDVKIGDKVSKGDLLITLSGEKKSEDTSKKTAVDSDHVIKKRLVKVPLIAWHKKAEEYYEAFQKGDRVRVKGSIRTRLSYKDDFCYPSFEIVVSDLILLNRKSLASMF